MEGILIIKFSNITFNTGENIWTFSDWDCDTLGVFG